GESSSGDLSGNIDVTAANVSLTASGDYVQIGHGGAFSQGAKGGDNDAITVAADDSITLMGGLLGGLYAEIGNGGFLSSGSSSATVTVSASGDVTISGRS